MPTDLTIFAAEFLVFIDAVLAAALLLWLLLPRSRAAVVRRVLMAVITVVLSYVFAHVGAALYNDPRPFTTDHMKPLISHAADNGFPSDHALLAAAVVAVVLLVSPLWSVPFVVLAFLVDWARVGAGIHHVQDVVGSSAFVALALAVAWLAGPPLARLLQPYLPAPWTSEERTVRPRGVRPRTSGGETRK